MQLMHPELNCECSPMLALHIVIIINNKLITNVTQPILKCYLLFSIDFRMPFYAQAEYIKKKINYFFIYFFFLSLLSDNVSTLR